MGYTFRELTTHPLSKTIIMKTQSSFALICFIAAATIASSSANAQITLGQVDDFTAVSDAGWSEGGASPNPPAHDSGLGLDGIAGHLSNTSDGAGAGGRWLMFNTDARWTGDYISAGVDQLLIDFDNRSGNGTAANFRVAFNGDGGWFISDDFIVADGAGWQQTSFDLNALNHLAGGTGVLADTLSTVNRFEILSSVSDTPGIGGSNVQGDNLVADFRVDNISAVAAVPEPGSLALMLCGLTGLALRRRR